MGSYIFQSTSPCGGRHAVDGGMCETCHISIHVPLRGTTHTSAAAMCVPIQFQSTSPCGGRHGAVYRRASRLKISIHVPLRGTTLEIRGRGEKAGNFNPRPLAGDDTVTDSDNKTVTAFQSTSPCGGRHASSSKRPTIGSISIHVPLRGTTMIMRRNG